ncbi:hypothetical protein BN946_scf184753.g38 [Trametes cinnabarina]|uniref:Uncharacterized protein n=1 Tax=Pycnoporus cinnabarinus TaxID=5643 RepID=A0A060SXR2_PYCCI|nr:hypothetical protein BN946_scf184753.g38 [Trametes cinnabarina]
MSNTHQTLDTIVGIVGLISVPPVIAALIYSQLPCTRLRELEEIFSETEGLLQKNTEAGLLGSHDIVSGFHNRLEQLRGKIEDVRVESHCATTYAQNLKKMLAGLSRRIYSICSEVKKLRAKISTTSARERERLRRAAADTSAEETISLSPSSSPAPPATDAPSANAASGLHACTSSESHAIEGEAADPAACFASASVLSPPHPSSIDGTVQTAPATSEPILPPTTERTSSAAENIAFSEERSSLVVYPEERRGARGNLSSTGSHDSNPRSRRYGGSRARVRMLSHYLRGQLGRKHASSSSTRGWLLIPSQTLATIALATDCDDPEWEDIAVRKVLPV